MHNAVDNGKIVNFDGLNFSVNSYERVYEHFFELPVIKNKSKRTFRDMFTALSCIIP